MRSPERPTLIVLGMYASGFVGGLFLFGLLMAMIGVGQFSIDDEQVSGSEFLRHSGLILGIFSVLLATISFAIATNKEWSRDLMVIFWLATAASSAVGAFTDAESAAAGAAVVKGVIEAIPSLIGLAIAWWYLYRKSNVASYYAALSADSAGPTADSAPQPPPARSPAPRSSE